MKYFTADWHLNEPSAPNTHTFLRPKDFNKSMPDNLIWPNFDEITELWFLGDMSVDLEGLESGCKWVADRIKCPKYFILGDKEYNNRNFTEDQAKSVISKYFNAIYLETTILVDIDGFGTVPLLLTHKPENWLKRGQFGVVGHIHGTKRLEKCNDYIMVNVGIDAWCMQVVPMDWIKHQITAGMKFYDKNIFPNG